LPRKPSDGGLNRNSTTSPILGTRKTSLLEGYDDAFREKSKQMEKNLTEARRHSADEEFRTRK
jgi:hypothetical protein